MIVQSFNGFDLSSTSYRARIVGLYNLARASNGFVQLSNDFPQDAGVYQVEPRTIALDVRVQTYTSRDTLIQALLAAMQPGVSGDLVCTFPGDGDYGMTCRVESATQDENDPMKFVVMLNAGDSTWKRTTATTASWTVTASGQTKSLTVGGSLVIPLSLTITPSVGVSSGYKYQQLYQLVNTPGYDYGTRPWCITIDTATLITAGKMQADCDDLRIFVNDVEVKRWISGANTATTKVWFNVPIGRGFSLDLAASVPSSGAVGELRFKATANNLAALKLLPAQGILQHGTEWFQYNGVSATSYRVAVVKRGALGTTQQAHAIGDAFKFIQNVVYVVYGDAGAVAPSGLDEHYDDEKPMFDLSLSDNSSWSYSASSGFYDPTLPNRPGSWKVSVRRSGDVSKSYSITQDAESGNPAMGGLIGCYYRYGRTQAESAAIIWMLSCPGGISQVSTTGYKERNSVRWPTLAALQKSADAATWTTVWNEASPVAVSTWTAVNQALKAAVGKHVRYVLSGSFAALADAKAYFEVLTCQVWFTSANLPGGTLLGEDANYPLSVEIENQTSGDVLRIVYPMQIGDSFIVDGELNTAACGGINAHGAIALDDESRPVWLRLEPGANVLEITADVVGTLGIALSWYARRA